MPAADGEENVIYNTKLDRGPAIYTTDAYTLYDPRLIHFACQTAENIIFPINCANREAAGRMRAPFTKTGKASQSFPFRIPTGVPMGRCSWQD